jgi:hypothetical protein
MEQRGYTVRQVTAAGIVPGARLQVKKVGEPKTKKRVAVRTSKDRKVGLMRDPDTGRLADDTRGGRSRCRRAGTRQSKLG